MSETWLPVPGYEGLYDVSDAGRVRSLDRYVYSPRLDRTSLYRGRILKPTVSQNGGYHAIGLWKNNSRVQMPAHRLVMAAFVGPLPDGMQTRHLNGQPTDNRLQNLAYGTVSENQRDRILHGTHNHANKPRCVHGHDFDEANTYITRRGTRRCRACKNIQARAAKVLSRRGA